MSEGINEHFKMKTHTCIKNAARACSEGRVEKMYDHCSSQNVQDSNSQLAKQSLDNKFNATAWKIHFCGCEKRKAGGEKNCRSKNRNGRQRVVPAKKCARKRARRTRRPENFPHRRAGGAIGEGPAAAGGRGLPSSGRSGRSGERRQPPRQLPRAPERDGPGHTESLAG